MTATLPSSTYQRGEHHAFEAAGTQFLYLVPSGSIFALGDLSRAVLDRAAAEPVSREMLVTEMTSRGFLRRDVEDSISELEGIEALSPSGFERPAPTVPPQTFPLQRIVLNLTNQCNLACTYCYEYSEDRITETAGKQKYMESSMARDSIDLLIRESGLRRAVHVTFFGGETLLNFHALRDAVEYAKKQCAENGKYVEFSLTTNATLLTDEIIDFLSEHRIGVTVSVDGDHELNDRMRIFHDGRGSYEVIAPNIRRLLARHRTASIGARVTLSAGNMHVVRIYRHLTGELGFSAAGFSPATANPNRLYHIGPQKMDHVLGEFEELAWEYRDYALAGRQHGFTNVSDTLKELYSGVSKAYPCGAGLGLLGVSPGGDISICHRFADSPVGRMGTVAGGVDHQARRDFLATHNLSARTDCSTCWARPVCAGGCFHEAYIHYGNTAAANLHYCDWIRGWNDLCLRIYGEISIHNPAFMDRFNEN